MAPHVSSISGADLAGMMAQPSACALAQARGARQAQPAAAKGLSLCKGMEMANMSNQEIYVVFDQENLAPAASWTKHTSPTIAAPMGLPGNLLFPGQTALLICNALLCHMLKPTPT